MRALTSLCRTLLPALAAVVVALPCAAQAPPLKLALQLEPEKSMKGDHAAAESVARRVATHLTPELEQAGWQVVRVRDAKRAAKSGRYHAAVMLEVDARPFYNVRDAQQLENASGKQVVLDYSKSVETWGEWAVWDGRNGKMLADGDIFPIRPKLQDVGSGRPELDDEESMARLLAEAAGAPVNAVLETTQAAR